MGKLFLHHVTDFVKDVPKNEVVDHEVIRRLWKKTLFITFT